MKYTKFKPIEAPDTGPDKDALILQIESDHYAAVERGDDEAAQVLEERRRVVSDTKSIEAARKAYARHVAETTGVAIAEASA